MLRARRPRFCASGCVAIAKLPQRIAPPASNTASVARADMFLADRDVAPLTRNARVQNPLVRRAVSRIAAHDSPAVQLLAPKRAGEVTPSNDARWGPHDLWRRVRPRPQVLISAAVLETTAVNNGEEQQDEADAMHAPP